MKTLQPYILMLEDDHDDRHITSSFFLESGREIHIEFLEHADEVLPYLEGCGEATLPRLIVLDKNVPRGNSMQALRQIKEHPAFRIIPVVMISGSAFPAEVLESYRLGVNSFISKPFNNEQTTKTIGTFISYWFDTVELPASHAAASLS
jgi:CheY-like chemotaxis protein